MADSTGPGDVVTKDKIKLPLWVWAVGGAVVVGIGYFWYRSRQSNAATASAAAAPGTAGGATPLYSNPTTILPMFQGGGGTTSPVQSLTDQQFDTLLQNNPPLPYSTYTVTGQGAYKIPQVGNNGLASNYKPVNDQWPTGVAIAAYGLSPNDVMNVTYFATMITLENLGVLSPYPVGTVLRIPFNEKVFKTPTTQPATNMQYLFQPQTALGTSASTAPSSGQ